MPTLKSWLQSGELAVGRGRSSLGKTIRSFLVFRSLSSPRWSKSVACTLWPYAS